MIRSAWKQGKSESFLQATGCFMMMSMLFSKRLRKQAI